MKRRKNSEERKKKHSRGKTRTRGKIFTRNLLNFFLNVRSGERGNVKVKKHLNNSRKSICCSFFPALFRDKNFLSSHYFSLFYSLLSLPPGEIRNNITQNPRNKLMKSLNLCYKAKMERNIMNGILESLLKNLLK